MNMAMEPFGWMGLSIVLFSKFEINYDSRNQ
ncbi:hypothetical protein R8510_05385 [Ralstonia chuxiongensis]|nr:hypothetical protein R8510_05385 [Ralstonia chuxiongensis]